MVDHSDEDSSSDKNKSGSDHIHIEGSEKHETFSYLELNKITEGVDGSWIHIEFYRTGKKDTDPPEKSKLKSLIPI